MVLWCYIDVVIVVIVVIVVVCYVAASLTFSDSTCFIVFSDKKLRSSVVINLLYLHLLLS